MSKRFTDTDKYKKPFMRGLKGAYKLLWDYLYHDCDHAGIWIVDFEIAQIYLGQDMPVNKEDAIKYFNQEEEKIFQFDNGSKWFIPGFISFQYVELNEENKAHNSVLKILKKHDLIKIIDKMIKGHTRGLDTPSKGAMDKDKDMVKDKDMEKERVEKFTLFWEKYPKKKSKEQAKKAFKKITPNDILLKKIIDALENHKNSKEWVKDDGEFIPHASTWLNQRRWEDEITSYSTKTKEDVEDDNHFKMMGVQ